jgi:hypothetical protein
MSTIPGGGLVAHQGGWDELLIAAGAILLVVLPRMVLERRRTRLATEPETGPCAYCSTTLGPELRRCPTCGFRARRGLPS